MKRIPALIYIFVLSILIQSCRRNDTLPPVETPVSDVETVQASVTGIVVNENNIPVQGAIVTLGSNTATTDLYGMFSFKNKSISKNNTHIKVTKAGYFNGNRSLMATVGRTHNVRIKLLPKTLTGTVNGNGGGVVTLASGGKVSFPASAIVDATGTAYTGTVNVAMAWLNPTATDLGSTIQGDLRGVTTTGNERVLETYGMLGVEITSATGQQLKIATGKTAEISLPIPTALQATAPASIPLWHFDEVTGRWKEEGSATKVGTNYVGSVAHFSFWNCDVPANFINLCVNVVNQSNQPLNNVTVRIRKANNPASVAYGQTDSLGNVCGAVPKNEPLVLEILDRCGNVVYTQNIGPYSANASVNVVANIPISNALTISGTVVNCSNAPVTNGSVLMYTGGGYYYNVPTNSSGAFNTTILNCSGATINFNALPIDNTTQQQGITITGSGTSGTVALGNLQACGTSSQEYMNLLIDGVPYNTSTPQDSIRSISFTPATGYSFGNTIWGVKSVSASSSIGHQVIFSFNYNNTIGSYYLQDARILIFNSSGNIASSQFFITYGPNVTLTTIGSPITGFLEGTINNIDMVFQPGNVTRSVVCNFRVRRP
jgi:hypothetical protein